MVARGDRFVIGEPLPLDELGGVAVHPASIGDIARDFEMPKSAGAVETGETVTETSTSDSVLGPTHGSRTAPFSPAVILRSTSCSSASRSVVERDRLVHGLGRRVAEQPLGPTIPPNRHVAVQVLAGRFHSSLRRDHCEGCHGGLGSARTRVAQVCDQGHHAAEQHHAAARSLPGCFSAPACQAVRGRRRRRRMLTRGPKTVARAAMERRERTAETGNCIFPSYVSTATLMSVGCENRKEANAVGGQASVIELGHGGILV